MLRIHKIVTRTRLEAAGIAAAFAFVVGLSGSASAGLSSADPVTAAPVTGSVFTVSNESPARERTAGGAQPASTDSSTGDSPASVGQALAESAAAAVTQAVAPEAAPAAPSAAELHPLEVTAAQQQFTPTVEQMRNAKAIVDAGKAMNLPPRAWTIAVATSLQESNLRNLGHLGANNDHDSLGLFQQRPSSGWGTPAQVQDPNYAATAFYRALVQVPGWDSLPLTVAAQKVQVSAYPNHYAKHETQAGDMIEALYGQGPYASVAAQL